MVNSRKVVLRDRAGRRPSKGGVAAPRTALACGVSLAHGIRVSVVGPGGTEHAMSARPAWPTGAPAMLHGRTPLTGRPILTRSPREWLFLTSDESSFVTGAFLTG